MLERFKEFTKEINEYGCQSDVREGQREGNQNGGPLEISALHSRVRFILVTRNILNTRRVKRR